MRQILLKIFPTSILLAVLVISGWKSPATLFAQNAIEKMNDEDDVYIVRETAQEKPKDAVINVIEFKSLDIEDALEFLEQESGYKIKTDSKILGTVSLDLQNISLWDALKIILEPNYMAYTVEGDVIRIMSQEKFEEENGYRFAGKIKTRIVKLEHIDQEDWVPKLNSLKSSDGKIFADSRANTVILMDSLSHLEKMTEFLEELDVPLTTELFHLKYIAVEDIENKLREMMTSNLGYVKFNERSNNIVITDTKKKVEAIRAYLEGIDKRIDIALEAEVFQIRLNEEHQDGVDWEAIVSGFQSLDLKRNQAVEQKLNVGTIMEEDYEILLEALETVGEIKSLFKTQLKSVANLETEVNLLTGRQMQEGFIKSSIKRLVSVSQKFDKSEVNIYLKFVPKIFDEKKLTFRMLPPLKWVLSNPLAATGMEEQIFLSDAPVDVKLAPDELIVMGGVSQEKEVSKVKKVPFLGNLPFVGFVFRRQNKLYEKTEYVIFVRSKVLEKTKNQ